MKTIRIRNDSPVSATLIVDGYGEVVPGQIIEVSVELSKALLSSKHWHLVADEPVASKAKPAKE